jgi:YHS domain-containing protein
MKARSLLALAVLMTAAGMIAASLFAAEPKAEGKAAETKAPGKDVKCPVSGKAVTHDDWLEWEKARVYFCCPNCPTAFKKDPSKYAAKAHLQMVQTEQLKEVACPFTGKALNPETAIDVGGVKVAFCCENCKAKAEKTKGDEQINLVFKDVLKGFKPASEVTK